MLRQPSRDAHPDAANVSPNPAQGTSQTFTASFHYVTAPEGTPIFFQVNGANPQVKIVHASGGAGLFQLYRPIRGG